MPNRSREEIFDNLAEALIPDEETRFNWLNRSNNEFYNLTPRELFKREPEEAIALLKLFNCGDGEDECLIELKARIGEEE